MWDFFPKINKRVGSNKACRWEIFLKKNKICCTLIREFRVGKGQYISKWIYEVIVSPKIWTKIIRISALYTVGQKSWWWLHKFILKFTDLYKISGPPSDFLMIKRALRDFFPYHAYDFSKFETNSAKHFWKTFSILRQELRLYQGKPRLELIMYNHN